MTFSGDSMRLDVYLQDLNRALTRSHIKNLISQGKVLVNGAVVTKAGYTLKNGDEVQTFDFDKVEKLEAHAQDIPLDIVYEDSDMLVINKPKGMVVHPAIKNNDGTLVNALLYSVKDLSGINGVLRPGIVHRLDKDTSGLLVVAKNDFAHVNLSNQISTKECRRIYISICEGKMQGEGEVINYLARSKKNRLKFACNTVGEGKLAHSKYKVIKSTDKYALVMWELKTGRTHQIRAHAEYLHHSIVGDKLYGSKSEKYYESGQMLHAIKLMLKHPRTGEEMSFMVKAPQEFENFVEKVFDIKNICDMISLEEK